MVWKEIFEKTCDSLMELSDWYLWWELGIPALVGEGTYAGFQLVGSAIAGLAVFLRNGDSNDK